MAGLLSGLTVVKTRSFGAFTFDATLSEMHRLTNTVTKQPVELGADLTDHVFSEPSELEIVAEVTDTPVKPNPSFDKGAASARSSGAYSELSVLAKTRDPFDIQTGLVLYKNMIIKDMSTVQSSRSANTLIVSIQCEQIKQVNIQVANVGIKNPATGKTADSASNTVQKGNQQTKAPTPIQESLLAKTVDVFSPKKPT